MTDKILNGYTSVLIHLELGLTKYKCDSVHLQMTNRGGEDAMTVSHENAFQMHKSLTNSSRKGFLSYVLHRYVCMYLSRLGIIFA